MYVCHTHYLQFLVDFTAVSVEHSQVQWSKILVKTVEKSLKKQFQQTARVHVYTYIHIRTFRK